MHRGRPKGGGAKPKAVKKTLFRLLSYFSGKYKFALFVVFICIIVSSLANVVSSKSIQYLINDYIMPMVSSGSKDFSPLVTFLGVIAAIFLLGIITTFLYNIIMVVMAQKIQQKIRDDMFSTMQSLPVKFFDTHAHGDVMSYYTNDIDTLRQMLSQSIPQAISSIITVIMVFVTMLMTSWVLTGIVVLTVIIMIFVAAKIGKYSSKYFVQNQKSIAKLNGYIEEMIQGQKVIKAFCHEERAKEDFSVLNEELRSNAFNANRLANVLMPVLHNMAYFQYAFLAIIGGLMAITGIGGINAGILVAFLLLSRSFNNPISQMSNQMNMIIMALAGAERIFDLMDQKPEADEGYVTLVCIEKKDGQLCEADHHTGNWAWRHPHENGEVTYTPLEGRITMDDVSFGYNEDNEILHDITLYGEPGEKIAFVGATGAGKTTITNLINRFYDIADGKIRYDGININKIKKPDLRRSLGMVLQDTNLFTGSVMENIRYGNLDATDEECINAAKLANADGFIRRLPNGYDTKITENGASLSQGQRQLISIARAAVADPPVMILDEATSSIDTRTEALVQKGMDALMKGRTVFVIAHRLSTVRNSDVIMVLDHGRIVERGNHKSLIEQKGTYYQLYTGAFELE